MGEFATYKNSGQMAHERTLIIDLVFEPLAFGDNTNLNVCNFF